MTTIDWTAYKQAETLRVPVAEVKKLENQYSLDIPASDSHRGLRILGTVETAEGSESFKLQAYEGLQLLGDAHRYPVPTNIVAPSIRAQQVPQALDLFAAGCLFQEAENLIIHLHNIARGMARD